MSSPSQKGGPRVDAKMHCWRPCKEPAVPLLRQMPGLTSLPPIRGFGTLISTSRTAITMLLSTAYMRELSSMQQRSPLRGLLLAKDRWAQSERKARERVARQRCGD